ncbi:probable E3 ubiquitin-protein ligase XERICO [Hibiscus syriacus]|uniref:probable E3 ubiquitin-protein ligase XERICO n=1 Tax=Hibiscus syriacus TaxID=106335 RepID=UPI0019229255|nr:probable E3 ubiquitin-protein ligase XERICO [Hibiscus syriacus]
MGLSNFPTSAEGVLSELVMSTVLSVAPSKNMVRSLLQVTGTASSNFNIEDSEEETMNKTRVRRVSLTKFKSLYHDRCSSPSSDSVPGTNTCCVCLTGFEADEEVSEMFCKHFFPQRLLREIVWEQA